MNEIDLVIPMVFPQDLEWQQEYRKYHSNDATKHVRFRSWGTEELLVRCCIKYMPWLHRIYLILASESQVQEWMRTITNNQYPITIVFHREFIPKRYLPCFSSPCFEMFLHRIPGLSEQFIYANDDMFPLSPLKPEDFFMDGKPCQKITRRAYPDAPNTFQRKCMYQQNMIGAPFEKNFTKTYPDTGHIFTAILKSSCEEVWRRHGEEIIKHLNPLGRTDHSHNNWIYALYQQYAGLYVEHRPARHYVAQGTSIDKLIETIRDPEAGIVCINDNECIRDWKERAEIVRNEIAGKLNLNNNQYPIANNREPIANNQCLGMKIALVAIGRRENRYAREFVEHYLGLGFDHIFIIDNNHDGEERFEDVLSDRITEGLVSVHDYRNRVAVQSEAYNDIYKQYGTKYNWLGFFDFDEFLVMADTKSVKQWLSSFKKDETVLVNWMCMTDSGLLYDDGRPCMERFTEAMPYDRPVQYDFPDNNHVKSFVRGGLKEVCFTNPHVPVTPHTKKPLPFRPYDFSKAYLKHFTTKTIGEWMSLKCQKGVGDRSKENFDKKYHDRFFKYNDDTTEKQNFIHSWLRNSCNNLTVAIVHYNTPKLTRAAVLSLWKHTPGCRVVIFDNSDRLSISDSKTWESLRYHPLVTIIDNTNGQYVDFDKLLDRYPDRQFKDRNKSNFGSAKHTASVDKLFDILLDGFILMDSDVLVRKDIAPLMNRNNAAAGELKPNEGVMRLLPLLCWLNVPVLKKYNIRYFNGKKMWALSDRTPNNRYDTGAWILEEINRYKLTLNEIEVKEYTIHLGHASWKGNRNPVVWIEKNRALWE